MKKLKIAMLGAGSGFVLSVAKELLTDPVFANCEFALMDPAAERLEAARKSVAEILTKAQHPVHLAEVPCRVIHALETNTPTYFDAINIMNNGSVSNLPDDVILDVPGIAIGGEVRSIHVGALPAGALEICRRQTVLHEMIAQATHEGDDNLAVQALVLDPYVRSLTQARTIWADYRREYKNDLTTFKN